MRVLVATESSADDRKTLAAIRSLARGGARVTLGGDDHARPVFGSRLIADRVRYPHPAAGSRPFVGALIRLLSRRRQDVLLPLSDHTSIPIAAERERLGGLTRIPVPDAWILRRAADKEGMLELARSRGIAVPRTVIVRGAGELDSALRRVGLPAVLKPRRGAAGAGVVFIDTPAKPDHAWERGVIESDPVHESGVRLLQEFVPGEVHDACLLCRHGEARAGLTQRRVLMHPRSGGPGVLVETTRDRGLLRRAADLLGALRWHGPAQVEFKVDSRDREPKLMEVNGRFWGTLGLSIRAGIDFPSLACRMALDGDVEPSFSYRAGLRLGWPLPYSIARKGMSIGARLALVATMGRWSIDPTDPLPHLRRIRSRSGTAPGRH